MILFSDKSHSYEISQLADARLKTLCFSRKEDHKFASHALSGDIWHKGVSDVQTLMENADTTENTLIQRVSTQDLVCTELTHSHSKLF